MDDNIYSDYTDEALFYELMEAMDNEQTEVVAEINAEMNRRNAEC